MEVAPQGRGAVEPPICLEGQAVPRLFLLGHQKCGTTSTASDLMNAGAPYFVDGEKESHMFDGMCGFYWEEYAMYEVKGCPPAATPEVRAQWLGSLAYRSCAAPIGTLLEATPDNIRLPGLPGLLSSLYGPEARRLGFVLLLREPLVRMQSYWYQKPAYAPIIDLTPSVVKYKTFAGYLSGVETKVQMYKAQGYRGMEKDTEVGTVYRSLYSLSLEPWLGNFSREQFVVVPMNFYFAATTNRHAVLRRLAEKFGATLSPSALGPEEADEQVSARPPLWQDVDNATVTRWYGEFFRPDLQRLAMLLADGVANGLDVSGYEGGPGGDAAKMFAYLCGTLRCLM